MDSLKQTVYGKFRTEVVSQRNLFLDEENLKQCF